MRIESLKETFIHPDESIAATRNGAAVFAPLGEDT